MPDINLDDIGDVDPLLDTRLTMPPLRSFFIKASFVRGQQIEPVPFDPDELSEAEIKALLDEEPDEGDASGVDGLTDRLRASRRMHHG